MRVKPLPKKWLIHKVDYEEFTGENDGWGNESYLPPVTIKHVRLDESTVFSRDRTQTKVLANAVIFVDSTHSAPVTNFKEQSKIKFNGKDYVIQKVIPCYYPNKNEVHHWELEVV